MKTHLSETLYAVEIKSLSTRRRSLAIDYPAGPRMFYHRSDACRFKRLVSDNGLKAILKVVKVTALYRWLLFALCHLPFAIPATAQIPPLPLAPLAAAATAAPKTNTWFMALTAVDTDGAQSIYSNEVKLQTTNAAPSVTLAWDRIPTTNVSDYRLYVGSVSGIYTNAVSVGNGTNYTAQLPLRAPQIVSLQLLSSTNALGPWLPYTNMSPRWTNPTTPRYFKLRVLSTNL